MLIIPFIPLCRVEVTFASGEKLLIDHILVAVGLQPSTDLGDSAGLEVHKEMGEKATYYLVGILI